MNKNNMEININIQKHNRKRKLHVPLKTVNSLTTVLVGFLFLQILFRLYLKILSDEKKTFPAFMEFYPKKQTSDKCLQFIFL